MRVHNPGVPEAIARVHRHGRSRANAHERFATAREFLEALKAATGGDLHALGLGPRSGASESARRRTFASRRARPYPTRRPSRARPAPRAEATPIEVRVAGSSKVGLVDQPPRRRPREAHLVALLAVSALLAGSLGAFLFVASARRRRVPPLASERRDQRTAPGQRALRALLGRRRRRCRAASSRVKGRSEDASASRPTGYAPRGSTSPSPRAPSPSRRPRRRRRRAISAAAPSCPAASRRLGAPRRLHDEAARPRQAGRASPRPTAPPTATPGVGGGQLKLKTD